MRIATTSGAGPRAPSLRDLVLRARGGDREAFGTLVSRERDRLVATARGLVGDHHVGEDCAQEAFVLAFTNLPSLRDPDRFRPWLARILVRVAVRIGRRRVPRTARLPDDLAMADRTPDDADEVRTALAALRAPDRTLLVLRYLDDLSYVEIGEAVGIDVKRVKSRLHEARVRLRRRVEALRGREEGSP